MKLKIIIMVSVLIILSFNLFYYINVVRDIELENERLSGINKSLSIKLGAKIITLDETKEKLKKAESELELLREENKVKSVKLKDLESDYHGILRYAMVAEFILIKQGIDFYMNPKFKEYIDVLENGG